MELKNYYELQGCRIVKEAFVYDMASSVRASKFPMTVDMGKPTSDITPRTASLGSSKPGSGHDQFLTGIVVNFNLTFSNKAWVEMERYRFVFFVSSQSTMHRICKFDFIEQVNDYVTNETIDLCNKYIAEYNENPTKEGYLKVLYNTPAGFQLTARLTTNYRALKTVLQQRKTHRLPEWQEFCDWIRTLPHFEELTQGLSTEE